MVHQQGIFSVGDLIKKLKELDPDTVVVLRQPQGLQGLTALDIDTGYCWFHPSKTSLNMQFKKHGTLVSIDDHAYLGVLIG